MSEFARDFLDTYKNFVTKNPLLANEIEVALKWMSYLVAGRFAKSPVVTEFIHSASKLLNLVNDSILKRTAGLPVNDDIVVEKLQIFLTVIDYAEVFAEVAARQFGGRRSRWLIVLFIELVKFIIRLLLVIKHGQGLQIYPPISPLNRQKDIPQLCEDKGQCVPTSSSKGSNVELTFTLKSSKRVMRTLEAAPPLVSRSWKLPKIKESSYASFNQTPSKLDGKYFSAEVLHLCRPLLHLASMGVFGESSWKPFLLSLGVDITSLRILRQKKDFNKKEKSEISHRTLSLLLYLLRSPFYDQYSKMRILTALRNIADSVFGTGLILRPLMDYLPEWQQTYFYAWSS